MPIMRLSLSPEVLLEQVEFGQGEDAAGPLVPDNPHAGEGDLYIYRPQSPLTPNTSYEATLEIGYTDGTGREHIATRVWSFTTSDLPKHDYASLVVLPLVLAGEGGSGALIGGELVIDGRCLYLGHTDGSRTLPIFEEGTVWWEGDTLFLRGVRYEVGDYVMMGGGEINNPETATLQRPDDSCDTTSLWMGAH
jgi:hypothetical protein